MPITHVAVILLTLIALLSFPDRAQHPESTAASQRSSASRLPDIVANDNRTPAGALNNGELALDLRAARGVWRPHAESGPALEIAAFGAAGAALSVPAPLIRVPAAATVSISIRNELDSAMRVHGLCEHG